MVTANGFGGCGGRICRALAFQPSSKEDLDAIRDEVWSGRIAGLALIVGCTAGAIGEVADPSQGGDRMAR